MNGHRGEVLRVKGCCCCFKGSAPQAIGVTRVKDPRVRDPRIKNPGHGQDEAGDPSDGDWLPTPDCVIN